MWGYCNVECVFHPPENNLTTTTTAEHQDIVGFDNLNCEGLTMTYDTSIFMRNQTLFSYFFAILLLHNVWITRKKCLIKFFISNLNFTELQSSKQSEYIYISIRKKIHRKGHFWLIKLTLLKSKFNYWASWCCRFWF